MYQFLIFVADKKIIYDTITHWNFSHHTEAAREYIPYTNI